MKKEYFVFLSEEERDNLDRLLDIDSLNDKLYDINDLVEKILWKIDNDIFYSKYGLRSDLEEVVNHCRITKEEKELLDNLELVCDNISHVCTIEEEIENLREDD